MSTFDYKAKAHPFETILRMRTTKHFIIDLPEGDTLEIVSAIGERGFSVYRTSKVHTQGELFEGSLQGALQFAEREARHIKYGVTV